MDPPVSWLMIRPGWKVYAADGAEVGEVDEVTGDDTKDIFDGLAMATSLMGQPRYIRAEDVAEIRPNAVKLSLSRQQVEALEDFEDPATSADIEVDNRGGAVAGAAADVRELEGRLVHPLQRHEHPMNVWRRTYLAIRRLIRR